jgi:hypothetical protein
MPEGCAMRMTKKLPKRIARGSQPDILKYLGNYSFETKAISRLLYRRT